MRTLKVEELSRRYGELVVLDGVSFTLHAGQIAAVVGPNGSGKTTLLRCVAGADRPDAGVLTIDGRRYRETDAWFRAIAAAVLDDIDFFPDLSVAEHLQVLAYAHGGPAGSVDEVVTELGLAAVRDQLPVTLSSGQRRRLALASGFVRPRRLLILDEPEQRLDSAGREWLRERLRQEQAAGTAVLLASHDRSLVDATADTTIQVEV
ncbi:heme ABC exporter ATP-binding protein CcmA [Natronosporangium hydrolyticum]|uniref:heme ABC exporter ATP-binding protein CcmA n=1 Tax=Natronosporangium hydrolyticum TaxID=2811111 RepID=UPI001EFA2783|nr:heme ABC exporter ATP-binding protein CcmA [Natronosporangium hydrolyticum]